MADRSNAKKSTAANKKAAAKMDPKVPLGKPQKKVVHWLRKNVPTKKTKFLHSHVVEYFAGAKAVDALVNDSPWSKDKAGENAPIVFNSREDAITFLDEMLKHKMFHRAKKIPVQEKEKKSKSSKKGSKSDGEEKEKAKDKTDTEREDEDKSRSPAATKKRKIRLDMHLEQVFVDAPDAFVWLYDPTPWYYWVAGSAIVLGVIAVCLFPLWPPSLRLGAHYLSLAAAGFLVLIIALALFKYVLFGALFALSGGKLRFWIFPNLTEDVGFTESFMPIYDYTYTGASKKKKDKDSDDEEEDDEEEEEDKKEKRNSESSEDSESRKSSTGRDFEMLDKNEDTD